jgi:hypothetical protein
MLDGPRPGLGDLHWTLQQLTQLRQGLKGLELVATFWVPAQRAALAELQEKIGPICDALEPIAVEADAEPAGRWARKGLQGFATLDAAADAAARVLRAPGLPLEVTVFPSAFGSAAPLIERADVLVSQNFPVAERDGHAISAKGGLGPEHYPKDSLTLARRHFPHVEIVSGLPAYGQAFAHMGPEDSMRTAIASSVAAGVNRIRFWSLKHIVRKNRYARRVIAMLR